MSIWDKSVPRLNVNEFHALLSSIYIKVQQPLRNGKLIKVHFMRIAGCGLREARPQFMKHLPFSNEKCKRKTRHRSIAFDFTHEQTKPHMLTEEESVKESSKPRLNSTRSAVDGNVDAFLVLFLFSVLISIPFTSAARIGNSASLYGNGQACVSSR